jgi:hypothetical protein
MKVFKYLAVIVCAFFVFNAHAQVKRVLVEGTLLDKNNEPLPGGNVVLLHAVDSTLIGFGTSNESGLFTIRNVKPQKVKLQISYLGFGTIEKLIEIPADSTKFSLGTITLSENANLLDEVIVKAEFIPIQIKKDTIEYNAAAYRLQANATVEDLLKKLPGIEVAADGTITAQGEQVRNVMVDGKKFFGNDTKMATQNIPADAIKKVQVFDKKSDRATFTGVSDGESEKTINLELKPDRKIGTFGEALLGYGTNNRFDSKLSANKFNNKVQLAFIGKLNNLNNAGFSFGELSSITGNQGGRGNAGLINNGNNSGLTQSTTAGLNLFYQLSPKYSLSTSYFLAQSDQYVTNLSNKQNFTPVSNFLSTEDSESNTDKLGHNVAIDFQAKPDSFNIFRFQSSVQLNNTHQQNTSVVSTSSEAGVRSSSTAQLDSTFSKNNNLNFTLNWTRRFRTLRRSISFNGSIGNTGNESDYLLDQEITSTLVKTVLQNQLSKTDNDNYTAYVEYREPLSRNSTIGISANVRNFRSLQDKDFYDIDRFDITLKELNNTLSSLADNNTDYQRASLLYSHDAENHNFNMDMALQRSVISNNVGTEKILKPFVYFLPSLTYNLTNKGLRFQYNTSINEPSTRQLQSIFDNSDPLNSYKGNPNLKPEYTHRFQTRYVFFDNFNFRNLFAFLNLSQTNNRIINTKVIDPTTFISFTTPENTKNSQNANLNMVYSSPLRKLKMKYRANVGYTLAKSINKINNTLNDVLTSSPRFGIELENTNNDIVSLTVGNNTSFSSNNYSVSTQQNNKVTNQQYYSNLIVKMGKGWAVEGNVSHSIYDASNANLTNKITMANANLSKRILKDKLTLKLAVADIFNVGKGISQNATNTYIEELITNNLGRYALLTAGYRLGNMSNNQQGGRGGRGGGGGFPGGGGGRF